MAEQAPFLLADRLTRCYGATVALDGTLRCSGHTRAPTRVRRLWNWRVSMMKCKGSHSKLTGEPRCQSAAEGPCPVEAKVTRRYFAALSDS